MSLRVSTSLSSLQVLHDRNGDGNSGDHESRIASKYDRIGHNEHIEPNNS